MDIEIVKRFNLTERERIVFDCIQDQSTDAKIIVNIRYLTGSKWTADDLRVYVTKVRKKIRPFGWNVIRTWYMEYRLYKPV